MISSKINLSVKKKKASSFHIFTLIVFIFIGVFVIASLYYKNDSYNFDNAKHNADINHYKSLLIKAKELSEKYRRITRSAKLPEHLTFKNENITSSESSFRVSTLVSSRNIVTTINSKDLILGMAQDTDAKNLAVFCKSLRRVSNASVIIFVNEPIPHMHAKLATENFVTLVPFNLLDLQPNYLVSYHPSTLRWILFEKHIQSNQHYLKIYDRIWMIDVRDSYFQKDPFGFVSLEDNKPSFHVFNGVEDKSIGQCSWNAGWIKDCFGIDMMKQIGQNKIICSGVSVGTTDMVIKYINVMSNIVSGDIQTKPALQKDLQKNFFPSCERNGVDQGVHNVLVHTGNIPSMKVWTQGAGPVANMQARVATVNTADYIVLNNNHEMYSVVHQYDRYPDLQRHLFKTYVDWIDTNNLQSEWEYESSCMKYSYKENVDLFKGICDLKLQGGATSAASCCKYCDKIAAAECKAFTYLGGQCFLKSCSKINSNNHQNQRLSGAVSAFIK